jgi:hypothetical protein
MIGISWLALLNFMEFLTRETLVLAILLFVGWGLIAGAGYLFMKRRYTALLYFEKNVYLKELFVFGF